MKLSKMNVNEMREFAKYIGADENRISGANKTSLKNTINQINESLPESWYLVRNGEILFKGTEVECAFEIWIDETGELEMYPADAYCGKE